MRVFDSYANYYDELYQEKDYLAECDFLERVFSEYSPVPIQRVLDLGCGTGGHAIPLSQRGYVVTGVDRSETMLAQARQKADGSRTTFVQEDIPSLDLGITFDAVIAMFAVMSYLTTDENLMGAFRAARRHLVAGGLFFFDAWFGPAVLMEKPVDRLRVIEAGGDRMMRFASPEMRLLDHTVDVNYKILQIRDELIVNEVNETHSMRFLFPQEVSHYLKEAGFQVRRLCPFLRLDEELTERDWNLAVVAEAV